ncbi:MAG: PadR family transcriptional regulator, partial [Candidatus Caldarchaeum sp.]
VVFRYIVMRRIWPSHGQFFAMKRGGIRLLILRALSQRPMHGYDVAKEISRMFGGLYEPSAGTIYPTLQWLEDEGMVATEMVGGKRVYRLTEAGARYLEDNRERLDGLMNLWSSECGSEKMELLKTGRRLAQTFMMVMAENDAEKIRAAADILEDARRRLSELVMR